MRPVSHALAAQLVYLGANVFSCVDHLTQFYLCSKHALGSRSCTSLSGEGSSLRCTQPQTPQLSLDSACNLCMMWGLSARRLQACLLLPAPLGLHVKYAVHQQSSSTHNNHPSTTINKAAQCRVLHSIQMQHFSTCRYIALHGWAAETLLDWHRTLLLLLHITHLTTQAA